MVRRYGVTVSFASDGLWRALLLHEDFSYVFFMHSTKNRYSMKEPFIKIAYADDHDVVRGGLVAILNQQANMKVIAEASNGRHLLDRIKQLGDVPDVAILDIDMPEMNGYETVLEMRRKYPKVRSIAYSFYENEFNIIKMIKNGAVGYLTKGNSSLDDIFTAVNEVHINGHYYSDSVSEETFKKAKNTTVPDISDRELEFLHHCCEGLSNKQIAEKMNVNFRSVENYYNALSKKLGIKTRIGIVAFILKSGIISLNT